MDLDRRVCVNVDCDSAATVLVQVQPYFIVACCADHVVNGTVVSDDEEQS